MEAIIAAVAAAALGAGAMFLGTLLDRGDFEIHFPELPPAPPPQAIPAQWRNAGYDMLMSRHRGRRLRYRHTLPSEW